MNKGMAITDPIIRQMIGEQLKMTNVTFYVAYECIIQTGIFSRDLLVKTNGQMLESSHTLSPELTDTIKNIVANKPLDDPFFVAVRNPERGMPERTLQEAIKTAALKCNYSSITIYSLRKTFYYNCFRDGGYQLSAVSALLRYNHDICGTVENFLRFCDVPVEEYDAYYNLKQKDQQQLIFEKCTRIIDLITTIKEKNVSPLLLEERIKFLELCNCIQNSLEKIL